MKPLATLLRDFHARLLELEAADGESVSGEQVLEAFDALQRQAVQVKPPAVGQIWQNHRGEIRLIQIETDTVFWTIAKAQGSRSWAELSIEKSRIVHFLASESYTLIAEWE